MSWQLSIIKQQCLQYKAQMTQSFVGLRCSGTARCHFGDQHYAGLYVCCQLPPRKLEGLLGFAVQSPTKVTSLLVEPNAALHADMTMRLSQPATLMHSFHIAAGSDMC